MKSGTPSNGLLDMATLSRADIAREAASLHPSTSPERIARDQRAAVREALKALGANAASEAVSEAVCLPVSVVVRRTAELNKRKRRAV